MNLARVTEGESSQVGEGDKSLSRIIESTGDDEALKLLTSGQTFSQDELDTALISACNCGYKFLVCEIIRLGANGQTRDRKGNTPLLICAENGFTNIARFFIRRQVDINAANYVGDTALILAIGRAGSVEMVKLLLAQTGINVNHQNKEGYTALMKAIEAMDIDVIKLLLDSQENAAEVLDGIKNCRNETAQETADKLGIGKCVKLLSIPDFEPILEAVETGDVDSLNLLIDCQLYDSQNKCTVINDAFKKIIRKHEKGDETFNEIEEKIIQRLLEHGANVNDYYISLDPIVVATKVGSYKVLQLLLEHAADVDSSARRSRRQEAPFEVAAENGRIDLIQLLLKHRSKFALSEFRYSDSECALKKEYNVCIRFLIGHGIKVDFESALRSTVDKQLPLHLKSLIENFQTEVKQFAHTREMGDLLVCACQKGNLDIIGLLLDAGANVNCINHEKKTPLMESKNGEVVYFLVQRGAVVKKYSRAKRDYSSPLTYILSRQDYFYDEFSKETIVEALLKCGAYVNGKSATGRTPLLMAVSNRESSNIVQMLLDHGAQSNVRDSMGNTPLLLAAQAGDTKNILCLLQFNKYSKAILNAQNYCGLTALMVASRECNLAVVKHLVDRNADVNITDVSGNTALLHAAANSNANEEIIRVLVTAGSDINFQNHAGFSPLMLAAEKCIPNILKLLINLGADVNSVSKTDGNRTALSILLKESNLESTTLLDCVVYLLDHGARASYASPGFIHKLIMQSKTQLIPKLIQCGLGPSEISLLNVRGHTYSAITMRTYPVISMVSPLCMALITGNVTLARYFVGNLFMTKSDINKLVSSQAVRQYLERRQFTECLGLLDEMSAQPMSLLTLALVAVQTAVGSDPRREERISMLPLSQFIKDSLLFKHERVKLMPQPLAGSVPTM